MEGGLESGGGGDCIWLEGNERKTTKKNAEKPYHCRGMHVWG